MCKSKLKTVAELGTHRDRLKADGKTIVHCHGVFDLLHIGHIRYFEQAKQMGDVLIVTLTPDRFVDKGPGRPAFSEALRAESIASMDSVDYVAINEWPTAEETLRVLRPDLYVKGWEFKDTASDYTGKMGLEATVVKEVGAKLAFAGDIVFSSSNLINSYMSQRPDEIRAYLELFKQRYSLDDIHAALDSMEDLNVLVIGDAILDEYQYCDAIGKSSKDPTLAIKYQSHEIFAGGALAVANHVAGFAKSVQLVSVIGERDSHEEFIRSQLLPNVTAQFFTQPDAPTLIKRRFIDSYSFNKLFEVYVMDDSGLPSEQEQQLCDWLRDEIGKYDLVIAADFGHGAIGSKLVRLLSGAAKFLAVNTQANAGNRGFNTITRYPHVDFASIAEHELRLETRDLRGDVRPYLHNYLRQLDASKFVVTMGRKGCEICDQGGELVKVPTFAEKTVDRVGAGDAFFSVAALAAAQGAPSELVGFLGNVVGSLAVEIIGNKKSIDKLSVKKYIVSLLK